MGPTIDGTVKLPMRIAPAGTDDFDTVLGLIAEDTGQHVDTIERDSRRDRWFTAEEARAYGFVDHIVDTAADVLPGPLRPIGLGARR